MEHRELIHGEARELIQGEPLKPLDHKITFEFCEEDRKRIDAFIATAKLTHSEPTISAVSDIDAMDSRHLIDAIQRGLRQRNGGPIIDTLRSHLG